MGVLDATSHALCVAQGVPPDGRLRQSWCTVSFPVIALPGDTPCLKPFHLRAIDCNDYQCHLGGRVANTGVAVGGAFETRAAAGHAVVIGTSETLVLRRNACS